MPTLWRLLRFGEAPLIFWGLCSIPILKSVQWESSCLKSSGAELSRQRHSDFHNKRERGNVQQQQEETVLNPQFVKALPGETRLQTHTCIRSLSVWGCSCLTWGVTIAGWGMPVVWGPGGPGIIWWENLKKERKENICTSGGVAKGGRILKQSTNCYWLKVKTHFYTREH